MRFKLTVFAALFVLFSSVISAQEFRATITGRVTDASGGVIPGAKIDATNQATNQVNSTVSDAAGVYTIPLLQPGTYTVSASATGFKSYVRANIVLNTGDRTGVDIAMEVGEVQQTVTVSAETPPIDTQTATLGFVVNTADVTEIPLNGRNPYMLASLSPAVNYMGSQQFQRPFDNGAIAEWSINGGLSSKNEFLLDGTPNNAQAGGDNLAWVTPVDSVSQFKVQTTTYDAEYGKTAGGIVNLTTKSGTDAFHGTVYDFLRRSPLDAVPPNSYITAASLPTLNALPVDHLDQYGFSLGGPAKLPKIDGWFHGKTFFFVNYEKYYQDNPGLVETSVPTQQMLGEGPGADAGVYDFSGLNNPALDGGTPVGIFNPFETADGSTPAATVATSGTTQTATRSEFMIANPFFGGTCPSTNIPAFSCNTTSPMIQGIPPDMVNPISLGLVKLYPAANANGVAVQGLGATRYGQDDFILQSGQNKYTNNGEDHFYNFISRVDQDFGTRDHVFFRFGADDRHQLQSGADGVLGIGNSGQYPLIRANYAAAADWTRTINPTLISDLRVSESQYVEASDNDANGTVTPAYLGFPASTVAQIPNPKALGTYSYSGGLSYAGLGRDPVNVNYTNTFAVAAKVMKVHGAHSFKVGADLRWIQENFIITGDTFALGFSNSWTQCEASTGSISSTTPCAAGTFPLMPACPPSNMNCVLVNSQGDPMATMLLGEPTSLGANKINVNPSYLTRYFAGYFQDDWRVSSKLSLNLGFRYDVHPPAVEGHHDMTDGWAFNQVNPVNTTVQEAFGGFTSTQTASLKNAGLPTTLPTLYGGLNYVSSSGKNADITDWTGIQPRLGMAYQVNQKLVFRGGWARYIVDPTNDWYQNLQTTGDTPQFNQVTSFGTSSLSSTAGGLSPGLVPFGSPCSTASGCGSNLLTNPFAALPTGLPTPVGNALQTQTLLGNSLNFFNPRYHLSWVSEFSAGVQVVLPFRSRLELTYVGNRGYKLEANNTYNVFPLALRQKCDPLEVLQLNPGLTAPLNSSVNPAYGSSTGPTAICSATVANPFQGLPQFNNGSSLFTSPTVSVQQMSLPFPEFTGGTESGLNLGKLWYNGMVATYTVRARSDLNFTVAYTWSNTVEQGGYSSVGSGGNANTDAGEAYRDPQEGILEQSVVPWNIADVVTISGVYQLPFGRGKRFAGHANRIVDGFIGGWEYNINALYQTGRPWSLPGGVIFYPNGLDGTQSARLPVSWKSGMVAKGFVQGVRPCVANMNNLGQITLDGFATAPNGTNPYNCTTSNYNFLVLPSFAPTETNQRTTVIETQPAFTANMSLAKTVAITERFKFQFRAEAFNVFNTPWLAGQQFSTTTANTGTSTFGQIQKSSENGTAFPNRVIQLGFKLIF